MEAEREHKEEAEEKGSALWAAQALPCWRGWAKKGKRENDRKQTWGSEMRPLRRSPLPSHCSPPPLTVLALPASWGEGGGRRASQSQAILVCLLIAQSGVMIQPAASDPAKYISFAGLDHTASP